MDAVHQTSVRVDPDCTIDCDTTRFPGPGQADLGTLKAVSGVDLSVASIGRRGLSGMIQRRRDFDNESIANARVVRTYADIEVARENGEHAIIFYVQRRPEDSDWQLDGDVGNLRRWHNEGLRILQISYGHNPPSRHDAHTPEERLGYGGREG